MWRSFIVSPELAYGTKKERKETCINELKQKSVICIRVTSLYELSTKHPRYLYPSHLFNDEGSGASNTVFYISQILVCLTEIFNLFHQMQFYATPPQPQHNF